MQMANLLGNAAAPKTRQRGVPVITFRLGQETYAFHINRVKEVVRYLPITRIPKAPEYMPGIINLRGGVVTVIDLGLRFGLNPVENPDEAFIIVIEIEFEASKYLIGLRVDIVLEVLRVLPDQMNETPHIGGLVATDYVDSIFLHNGTFISILNLDKSFDVSDLMHRATDGAVGGELHDDTNAEQGKV
jgi:purine-binding chemotaxis protein CheW